MIKFTTDKEDAILTLKDSIKLVWEGETIVEESPVKASQSNGQVENANQQVH